MDQPASAPASDSATITLTSDMRPLGPDKPAEAKPEPSPSPPGQKTGGRFGIALGLAGLLVGLGALGAAAWSYNETQKEILRLSTEIAQLRVSLDLYARNGTGTAELTDLGNRLSALEQGALSGSVPMPGASAVEPSDSPAPGLETADEDCLPIGMRLLVAAGDSYPICGQPADVTVSAVSNGYITLSDGTSVASGGTTPLPGLPACTLAVTSGGDEGLTGYAEIRVNC